MPPSNNPKYTFLLCFDFDGTLAHPSHDPHFHPRTLEYLKALRGAGAAWVVISGRGLKNLLRGFGENGLFTLPDLIVANEYEIYLPDGMNGWSSAGSWNQQISRAQVQFRRGHLRFLRDLQQWVKTDAKADMLEDETGNWGIVAETIDEMERICGRIESFQRELPDLGFHRNGRHLRFSHAGYNKGAALAELGRMLEIGPERTFTAGDNHNDLPMLAPELARFRACPANAEEEIKNHLRDTSGYVANAEASLGMMEAMRYFFQANLDELKITTQGKDPLLENK